MNAQEIIQQPLSVPLLEEAAITLRDGTDWEEVRSPIEQSLVIRGCIAMFMDFGKRFFGETARRKVAIAAFDFGFSVGRVYEHCAQQEKKT